MIRILTLGRLDLVDEQDRAVRAITRRKRLALLLYLAVDMPGTFRRRDHLLALFWPDSPEGRARHSLRESLRVLRSELGPGTIRTRGDGAVAQAEESVFCDIVEFDRAYASGEHARALSLSDGPFLDGVFLDASPGFEDWCATVRERHRVRAAECALHAGRDAGARHAWQEAVALLRRGLDFSPYDEALFRQYLVSLLCAGLNGDAVREYRRFRERLLDEFEVEPAPATTSLFQALVKDRSRSRRRLHPVG